MLYSNPFTKAGWMSPDGTHHVVSYRMDDWSARLHLGLAKKLIGELYPDYTEDDSDFGFEWKPQRFLLLRGWIRIDSLDIDFMMHPTPAQHKTLNAWLQWRLDSPDAPTLLGYQFFDRLQEVCNWLNGDPTGDYAEFETKANRHDHS